MLANARQLKRRADNRREHARLRSEGRRLVQFLHPGKTGGTAVKGAMRGHEDEGRYRIVLNGHDVTLPDIPEGDLVVFFLRDPVHRYVSGFNSRLRQGQPRHTSPWTRPERRAFERFGSANALAAALSAPDRATRRHAIRAMHTIGHVRHRYSNWFGDEDYFLSRRSDILFVGFQETLETDFVELAAKLGLPESVKLPTDEVGSHRSPQAVDKTMDAEAEQNLREWYAADYRFIELCRKEFRRVP